MRDSHAAEIVIHPMDDSRTARAPQRGDQEGVGRSAKAGVDARAERKADLSASRLAWPGRALLFAAVLPLTLSTAQACHRFSVWKYPYPQRCAVTKPQIVEDRNWYVEFVLPDDERAAGIEALKKAMAK